MGDAGFARGSAEAFDRSWRARKEASYNHWTRSRPTNQIQLAFRQHWDLFQELVGQRRGDARCLEVGAGRGSISAYFADAGYACTLLDTSAAILKVARDIFSQNRLAAHFATGDALDLPFASGSFDVVVSIGLLEHFVEYDRALREQVRVLRPAGHLLAYIVPHLPDNIQRRWRWLNATLAACARFGGWVRGFDMNAPSSKEELYRSDALSGPYVDVLSRLPVFDVRAAGLYPLPMISHSPEFPFSLLPWPLERLLVGVLSAALSWRRRRRPVHAWLCDEGYGQAILVSGRKAVAG